MIFFIFLLDHNRWIILAGSMIKAFKNAKTPSTAIPKILNGNNKSHTIG